MRLGRPNRFPSLRARLMPICTRSLIKLREITDVIAKKLVRHGVTPLFDKWCLPPGRIFQREIEHVFPMVRCVAIFIGSRGIGPWEEVETRIAIDEATKRTIPIIPVRLPGSSKRQVPLLLAQFHWVRFRKGLDEIDALRQLLWGIKSRVQVECPP